MDIHKNIRHLNKTSFQSFSLYHKNDYFYAIKEHKASKMQFDAIVKAPDRWTMFCNRVSC